MATKTRQFTRMRDLAADPRVTAIQDAVRACEASCRLRSHLANGEYAWPKHFVAALDHLSLCGASPESLLAIGQAFADAARQSVYVGTGEPVETLGEALALEAAAEGDANQATAMLVDGPRHPSRLRAALQRLTRHGSLIERTRVVLHREIASAERQRA